MRQASGRRHAGTRLPLLACCLFRLPGRTALPCPPTPTYCPCGWRWAAFVFPPATLEATPCQEHVFPCLEGCGSRGLHRLQRSGRLHVIKPFCQADPLGAPAIDGGRINISEWRLMDGCPGPYMMRMRSKKLCYIVYIRAAVALYLTGTEPTQGTQNYAEPNWGDSPGCPSCDVRPETRWGK